MNREMDGTYTAKRPGPMPDDPILSDMMDYYLVRKTESYKFIRMADDLHDVASYLNEMRICFLLLTGTVYIILAIYFVTWCVRRNRRRMNNPAGAAANRRLPNHRWGELQGGEYENAVTAQTNVGQTASDDLVSVRSDGALPPGKLGQVGSQAHGGGTGAPQFGMAGRGGSANRQAAPSFMRHSGAASMQNHRLALGASAARPVVFEDACSGVTGGASVNASTALLGSSATTRLMADTDTGTATLSSKQPISAHHHHHLHPQHSPHAAHQTHQQVQQQQADQQVGSTPNRSPGCLLNNISEEKDSGSNSASSSNAGTMSTFGWRNKEKVLLERHELQPLNGANGSGDV